MRVLFAGGGTGGHLYPALALAEVVRRRHPESTIAFMGTPDRIEATRVPQAGYPFYPVEVMGMPRRLGPDLFRFAGKLVGALGTARRILCELEPQVVVGTGGYVSAPAILAAALERVPVLVCEQNALPGLANRLLARGAREVVTAFEASNRFFPAGRARCLGNPLRAEVVGLDRAAGRARLGLDPDKPLLLVTGGSLGARAINQAVVAALPTLLAQDGWIVLHVSGPREFDGVYQATADHRGPRYRLEAYLEQMPAAIAASDLVLSRAGATTLAELTAAGKPMVLVPFEHGGHDQPANARDLAAAGAAVTLREAELSRLAEVLVGLMSDPARRQAMGQASRAQGRPDAAERIVDRLEALAGLA